MAEDAENDRRSADEAPASADLPNLAWDARRRIGHHLQNLYAPALRVPLDERLVELLNQIGGEAVTAPNRASDASRPCMNHTRTVGYKREGPPSNESGPYSVLACCPT